MPTVNQDNLKDSNYRDKGEGSNRDDIIHISLINEDMLNYDADFFQREDKDAYYRPYFYEFYAHSSSIDKNALSFLMESQGKWMTGKFYSDEKPHNERGYTIPGDVFFSASPFKIAGKYLTITDKTVPVEVSTKYLSTYDTSGAVVSPSSTKYIEMSRIIDETMSSDDFITRIYNVGQGNCVYIRTSENKRILFDIGYNKNPGSSDWNDYHITRSKFSIMHMKPHLNILSHWDMDHIIGVTFAQNNMFDHPWIAPNLNELSKISASAARLAKYLFWKNQLYLVDDSFLGNLVCSGRGFNLWRGIGRNNTASPKHGLNKANNFGLIIELIGDNRMLLPGDCEYTMFPSRLNFSTTRYNYLMVPHHCSKMERFSLARTLDSVNYAIISAGDNSYNPRHPYGDHMNQLKNVNYNILQTIGNWGIEIPSINGSTGYKIII
ncbi:hypothetical protein G9F71_016135 [Clostridium sp. FP2]|uniref:hypothetical protein n=1 Tax=Clostridium sp. FP2 TaxID=2724481 RepID=UPI0013E92729|nr:hypothetical protein [Clostridium sp. FP2]MBZ9624382.1 hypothetical protein [Clostridium sp. FP2]